MKFYSKRNNIILSAVASGYMRIGDIKIPCSTLSDQRQLITGPLTDIHDHEKNITVKFYDNRGELQTGIDIKDLEEALNIWVKKYNRNTLKTKEKMVMPPTCR